MTFFAGHQLFKNIRRKSGIDSLDKREQRVLFGGILFVVCFLLFQFVVVPFFESRTKIEKSIERKRSELVNIAKLQKEYEVIRSEAGGVKVKLSQRAPDFTLFTFLDKQATASKVKNRIKYMKPSTSEGNDNLNQSVVEMKLQRVTLKSLVLFIRLVESVDNVVSIRRISIQQSGREPGYLDVILQIMTFELKE